MVMEGPFISSSIYSYHSDGANMVRLLAYALPKETQRLQVHPRESSVSNGERVGEHPRRTIPLSKSSNVSLFPSRNHKLHESSLSAMRMGGTNATL